MIEIIKNNQMAAMVRVDDVILVDSYVEEYRTDFGWSKSITNFILLRDGTKVEVRSLDEVMNKIKDYLAHKECCKA